MKKFFKSKKVLILSIICLVLVLGGAFYYFGIYKGLIIKPKVEIIVNGGAEYNTNIFDEYKDEGITLNVGHKEIDKDDYKVTQEGEVDVNTPGEYEIKYKITYDGKTYESKRKVIVKDLKGPEIAVNVETVEKNYCDKKNKVEIVATANDNVDGDVSANVTQEEKEDKLIITVKDAAGNESVKELPIVIDPEPAPIVHLNGSKTVYVKVGNGYEEKGATATDGCGNPIENEITTSGEVNVNAPGNYPVKYSVTYKEMTGEVSREVRVVNSLPGDNGVGKTVYLTFDDGPGAYTQELLDVLDKYGVKATFFVTNQFPKYQYMIGEEAKRGHAIAVHSLTHSWDIYKSYAAYRADFDAMNDIIEQYAGYRSKLFRFPGGSSNTKACYRSTEGNVIMTIKNNMEAEGIQYFDWNVDSNDAGGAGTDAAYNNVVAGMRKNKDSVVLMHDIHKTSIPAVERIIQYGLDNGYTFAALDTSSPKAHHGIKNCN